MNWYFSENNSKSVRQVVIGVDPQPVVSRFGTLMLLGKYDHLRQSRWTTGFFRLDSDPGPFLLVKANDATARLKAQQFRIAYCFYRMKAGGLISLFVDFPSITIPGNPCDPFVLFEMTRGLDGEDERQRISDGISKQPLHLCFAEGAGDAIEASYDVLIDVATDCREALDREWKGLLEFHQSIPGSRRDFGASVAQMQQENPLSENPIIRPLSQLSLRDQWQIAIAKQGQSQRRPWWAFWR
jgi:hypothetical protein